MKIKRLISKYLKPNNIYLGDCLDLMSKINANSVDMIYADLPYGTTSCKWDTIIPLDSLWDHYKRIIKSNGAIVLHSSQPFTTKLISSNYKMFKYCWIWDKYIPSGMGFCRYQPMRQTEDIIIFCFKSTVYNPQMIKRDVPIKSGGNKQPKIYNKIKGCGDDTSYKKTYDYKQPINLIQFNKVRRGGVHPTQKPIALAEYLIKTYTNENDLVLDSCSGSGTTALACKNLNRKFICIEKEEKYFDISLERLKNNERKKI